jgi:hypothetical protein
MLIIWDRLFGTYEAEEIRQDAYGLAKQPNTFSIVRLNTNHFKAMSYIGSQKSNWFRRTFARRIKARWTCSLSALFRPIKPMREDRRISDGPVRKKFNGHRTANVLNNIIFVFLSVIGISFGLAVMLTHKSDLLDSFDVAIGMFGAMFIIECATHVADQSTSMVYIPLLQQAMTKNFVWIFVSYYTQNNNPCEITMLFFSLIAF